MSETRWGSPVKYTPYHLILHPDTYKELIGPTIYTSNAVCRISEVMGGETLWQRVKNFFRDPKTHLEDMWYDLQIIRQEVKCKRCTCNYCEED